MTEMGVPSDERNGAFRKTERILLSILIVFLGMFLTLFTGSLSPPDGIINPFWGSVFGFGFWAEYSLFGLPPVGILGLLWGLVGLIIWPVLVLIVFGKIVTNIRHSSFRLGTLLFYIILLVTAIYNIPVNQVQGSWINNLPIFIKYLDFGPR